MPVLAIARQPLSLEPPAPAHVGYAARHVLVPWEEHVGWMQQQAREGIRSKDVEGRARS